MCYLRTWWRHQMETFSALLALCAGNSPVPVNSPHKGQWRGALMFSLICARINDWVNKLEAGDLWRHRGHYDVNVMTWRIVFQSLFRWCNAIETWHNPIATAPELHLFCIKQSISLFLLDFGFPHLCRISYDYGLLHQSGRSPKVVALFLQLTLVALL